MNTTTREIVSRLTSRPRAAPLIATALLVIAPLGVLVSQEAPPTTAPAQSPATAKKPAQPATKPAPSTAKPASETKPAAASTPAAESGEADSADVDQSEAPKRFIPSQKSSADNSATFPIDI
jgi:hypothetical protein